MLPSSKNPQAGIFTFSPEHINTDRERQNAKRCSFCEKITQIFLSFSSILNPSNNLPPSESLHYAPPEPVFPSPSGPDNLGPVMRSRSTGDTPQVYSFSQSPQMLPDLDSTPPDFFSNNFTYLREVSSPINL